MVTFLLLALGILYSGFLIFLAIGILRLSKPSEVNTYQNISVIVAARNEEKNLDALIHSLCTQNYPIDKYEIIIVDDRSTDRTSEILSQFQMKIPNLRIGHVISEKPDIVGKKNALDTGIRMASYDILAFTDADCTMGKNWLREIDRYMTPETNYLAGYSYLLMNTKPIPSMMKNLERAIYAAIAAGSFGWKFGITCTATNIAYRRTLFDAVQGFAKIGHIRSGDDDLMMLKMMPFVQNLNYMTNPEAFVEAKYSLNLYNHMALETRRASKIKYYPFYLQMIAFIIFLCFIYFYISFFMCIAGMMSWATFIILLLIKTLGEIILIVPFLSRIKKLNLMKAYPYLLIYYPFHFLFFSFKGTFGKYKWKS